MSAGVAGKLHWGTQYNVTLSGEDEESTFNDFIEEWSGTLQASVTQPLLRGAGRTVNKARIWQAENARYQSEEALRLTVMQTMGDVIKAYWDLAGSVENVRVRRKSVDNAERLLEITQKRLDIGTASPLDVVQAQAGVATRQSDLISAQSLVADAGDQLKRLANIQDDGRLSGKLLMPVDRPSPEPVVLDVESSIDLALEHRPEVRNADLAIANAEIGLQEARNGLLPQLDLQGSVSRGGRDHKPREVFYGIRDNNDHTWSVGLTGSLPLRNRSARGNYHVAEIGLDEAALRKEQTIQDLILRVRVAARAVDTNQFLVESNRQTRLVQETNLKAEERRLTLGLTTNFQILQVEEDLTTAEVGELRAMIELEKSLVDLSLSEGVLLDRLGIEFAAPEARRPTNYFRGITPFVNPRGN
jgi:outer membrane protein TolC